MHPRVNNKIVSCIKFDTLSSMCAFLYKSILPWNRNSIDTFSFVTFYKIIQNNKIGKETQEACVTSVSEPMQVSLRNDARCRDTRDRRNPCFSGIIKRNCHRISTGDRARRTWSTAIHERILSLSLCNVLDKVSES